MYGKITENGIYIQDYFYTYDLTASIDRFIDDYDLIGCELEISDEYIPDYNYTMLKIRDELTDTLYNLYDYGFILLCQEYTLEIFGKIPEQIWIKIIKRSNYI